MLEIKTAEIEAEQIVVKAGLLTVDVKGLESRMARVAIDGKPLAVTKLMLVIEMGQPVKVTADFVPQ